MATVIDALVVTLGLDPSGFTKGQKEAASAVLRTKNEATGAAKEMEARGAQAAEFFGKIRNAAIGLFAVFTGANSFQQFARQTTASDAALGRLSRNLGLTTRELSSWQGAVERTGGSASALDGTLSGLSREFQQFQLTGQSSVIPFFRAIGVQIADASGKMRPMSDILLDISDKFKNMDPARASAIGAGLGLDQGTINLLMKGRDGVRQLLGEQNRLGTVSKEQADAAERLQKAWMDVSQAFITVGRQLLTDFTPAIIKGLEALRDMALWFQAHPDAAKAFFGGMTAAALAWSAATVLAIGRVLTGVGVLRAAGLVSLLGPLAGVAGVALAMRPAPTQTQDQENEGLGRAPGTGAFGESAEDAARRQQSLRDRNQQRQRETYGAVRNWWNEHMPEFMRIGGDASPTSSGGGNNGSYQPILDLIGRAEGTDKGRGYNETFNYGAYTGGERDLSGMTLAEINKMQREMIAHPGNTMRSSVVGRYQFNQATLREYAAKAGLNWETDKFTPANQDKMARALLDAEGHQRALAGQITPEQYQLGLARRWASIQDPRTGQGYHDGQRRPALSQATVSAALAASRATGAGAPGDGIRFETPVTVDPNLRGGAATAVAGSTTNNRTSTSTSETSIGTIVIHTQATDAEAIGRGVGDAVRRQSMAAQATMGLE